jgi:hypothetical protein
MKNSISTLLLFLSILFVMGCALLFSACEEDHRVKVCHKGKIITIDKHAVPAHQGHGDAVDLDGDGYFTGDNSCSAPDCDDTDPAINDCTVDPCSITDLELLNATCTDPTDTYDLQLRVTFENPPAAGTLDVTIDGALTSFAIGTSPQIVNVFGLPPTGVGVDVTASFSDEPTCELSVDDLYDAPDCGL